MSEFMLGSYYAVHLTCRQIMRRPAERVKPEETVAVAAKKMRDLRIGFLPVCDAAGKVLGIVTDRDIAIRLCAENQNAATTRVNAIMSRDVISCSVGNPAARAEELMTVHLKLRIVVLEDDGRLAGIISLTDLAHYLQPTQAAAILRKVSARARKTNTPAS
jgi:CBS domain-containing protein